MHEAYRAMTGTFGPNTLRNEFAREAETPKVAWISARDNQDDDVRDEVDVGNLRIEDNAFEPNYGRPNTIEVLIKRLSLGQ